MVLIRTAFLIVLQRQLLFELLLLLCLCCICVCAAVLLPNCVGKNIQGNNVWHKYTGEHRDNAVVRLYELKPNCDSRTVLMLTTELNLQVGEVEKSLTCWCSGVQLTQTLMLIQRSVLVWRTSFIHTLQWLAHKKTKTKKTGTVAVSANKAQLSAIFIQVQLF